MRSGHSVPHLRVTLTAPEGPVAEVIERDAQRSLTYYPDMTLAAPIFGYAVEEYDGGWRLLDLRDTFPQMARSGLGQRFFLAAKAATEAGDEASAAEYSSAEARLYRDDPDEMVVAGARYRIVRAQPFLAVNDDGPEPPRATDVDTPPPGAGVAWEQMRDVVIVPPPPVGPAGAALMLEFAHGLLPAGVPVPAEVRAGRRACDPHPPRHRPRTPLLRHRGADRQRLACTFPFQRSPSEACDNLIRYFRPFERKHLDKLLPETRRHIVEHFEAHLATDAARQAHENAAQALERNHFNEVDVADHRYRIARAGIAIRLGPDGPEPPRPSDPDPRYQGITDDEEDHDPA